MSVFKITPDNIEHFSLLTYPRREFSSSSNGTVSGQVYVFPHRSTSEKHFEPVPTASVRFADDHFSGFLNVLREKMRASGSAPIAAWDRYLSLVNQYPRPQRFNTELFVSRHTPNQPKLAHVTESAIKSAVVNNLLPYHRSVYPTAHFAYTNYNCLNFFTGSGVDGSAIIYPNFTQSNVTYSSNFVSGVYVLTGGFSFEFYIKPCYKNDRGAHFNAGTVFHLSSSYAVSLVSGTRKDVNGQVEGYRIMLQLSHSANVSPTRAVAGGYPNDLIFMSDDNTLDFNRWHHVVVRWGGPRINAGTGTFMVDGVQRGYFELPSATIAMRPSTGTRFDNPDALVVGNFYDGCNGEANTTRQRLFFSKQIAQRDGIIRLEYSASVDDAMQPGIYKMSNSLNAEVHDLRIWRRYLSTDEVVSGSGFGLTLPLSPDLAFYLPPFFVKEGPMQRAITVSGQPDQGGIMYDLSTVKSGTTSAPFNPFLSHNVGGRDINVQNYLRDFANGTYPRALDMVVFPFTASLNVSGSANHYLHDHSPAWRKRNLTVLPCDDGNFVPDFTLLATGSSPARPGKADPSSFFVNDLGVLDRSLVSLRDMLPPFRPLLGEVTQSLSGTSEQLTWKPAHVPSARHLLQLDQPTGLKCVPTDTVRAAEVLQCYEFTKDPSSNEIAIFNVSNLFYGNRILPGSLTIVDTALTGSGGKVRMTLKDDGNGNVYRADCYTSASAWNSVGNVLYDEGIVLLKSPHVAMFGQDQFTISFKGEHNIHTMRVNVVAPAASLNSSSNPNYQVVSASFNANEPDGKFVYLTGMNFHDEDFNVVMRTQFAQPFVKRSGDKIMVKSRIDF